VGGRETVLLPRLVSMRATCCPLSFDGDDEKDSMDLESTEMICVWMAYLEVSCAKSWEKMASSEASTLCGKGRRGKGGIEKWDRSINCV